MLQKYSIDYYFWAEIWTYFSTFFNFFFHHFSELNETERVIFYIFYCFGFTADIMKTTLTKS